MSWISTKDRLPDPNVDVLVFNSDGVRVAYRWEAESTGKWFWTNQSDSCGCCDTFDSNPKYWMPLPEPPKDE